MKSEEDLFKLVSSMYIWKFVNQDRCANYSKNEDGSWKFTSLEEPFQGDETIRYFDYELVEKTAEELTQKEGKLKYPVVYFHAIQYGTSFALFMTPKGTYLIPYSSSPDWTGLTNGTLYTGKEVLQILDNNIELPENIESIDPYNTLGGIHYEPVIDDFLYQHMEISSVNIYFYVFIGILFTGAAVFLLVILKNGKRKRPIK